MPDDLIAFLEEHKAASVGFFDDAVTSERRDNLDRYLGKPYGDEEDGRSEVVSHDVAEVVDWAIPDIMRIFSTGEKTVIFEPKIGRNDTEETRERKIASAAQATDVIEHIFWKENNGFRVVHDWAKDGFIQKVGFVKCWWEDTEEKTPQTYDGLSILQVTGFENDPEVEIVSQDSEDIPEFQEGSPELERLAAQFPDGKIYTIEILRTNLSGGIKVMATPPEEILYARQSRSLDDSPYVAHRCMKMISDIIAEGLADEETALSLGSSEDLKDEKDHRFRDESDHEVPETDLTREVEVLEEYVRFDFDEDGVAELRQVIRVGSEILSNEAVDEQPFTVFSPNPMSHAVTGLGLADQVKDIQRIKTVVTRQSLDNLYLSNNPRKIVNMLMTNENTIDDLLTDRIGAITRVDGPVGEAIADQAVPFFAGNSFQMLEHLEVAKERRTGVTRLSQGLPDQALSDNATTTIKLMAAAESRKELIARFFGNSMGDLFEKMLRLLRKYQDAAKVIRLRNDYIPVDPRTWRSEFTMSVKVGLGTGDKERKAASLGSVLGLQQQAIEIGLSSPEKLYNTATDLVEAMGLPHADRYFNDPSGSGFEAPETPKSDAEVKAETDIKIAQMKAQNDRQIEKMKTESRERLKMREMQIEAELEGLKAGITGEIDTNIRNPL